MRKEKQKTFQVIDLETTGLHPRDGAEIFSYCIAHEDGDVEIWRYGRDKGAKERLQKFLNDTSIIKIAHHYKFEYKFLTTFYNVPKNTEWHCTFLMHQHLRNLHPSHGLDGIAEEYFPDYYIHYKGNTYHPALIDKAVKQQAKARGKRWDRVDEEYMDIYQYSDGQRGMLAFQLLYPEITKNQRAYDCYLVDIEKVKVALKQEDYGLMVDVNKSTRLKHRLEKDFRELVMKVRSKYGEFINLGSEKQLTKLLYEQMKLPEIKNTKKGKPATDKDVMMQFREMYPEEKIFEHVMQWRALKNGITTIQSYIDLADEDHIMHPSINTNKARTGRPSCENPNLLNVAKDEAMKNLFPVPARGCFCARPKRVLWFFDEQGIELRLIAERSDCQKMIDIFSNGGDPHRVATIIFYGMKERGGKVYILYSGEKKWKELTPDEFKVFRGSGKNTHFALPYGARPEVCAKTLNWPLDRTVVALAEYAEQFPEIFYFAENMRHKTKKIGYIITPFGRKIRVPLDDINSAGNYDIQATAAEIMKRSEIRVDKFLTDNQIDIFQVLSIYDELILCAPEDMPKSEKRFVVDNIVKCMTDFPEIKVKLGVEMKESSGSWNEAKKINVGEL